MTNLKQRKREASVLREAAMSLEKGGYGCSPYSCDHISRHARCSEESASIKAAYQTVWGRAEWWDVRGDGFFASQPVRPEWREERILALCFAAAMAETGDLP